MKNIFHAVKTLITHNRLTLTALGRESGRVANVRYNIQWSDRLIGNKHLHKERTLFYGVMCSQLLVNNPRPLIHVDWSCLCSTTNLYVLRASLSMSGRSVTLYEKCYPKSKENNHATHKEFLTALASLLPDGVSPTIVADAGFRVPWFTEVEKLGWNFVGRLRNRNLICLEGKNNWQLSKELYDNANSRAKALGFGALTKERQLGCYMYLYKGQSKGRHKVNLKGQKSRASKSIRHSQSQKEPWLLVSSVNCPAKKIVAIYQQRMRIEENFRDTKSTRYGFGLSESLTYKPERMDILLLIGALATFACCLAGLLVRQRNEASSYQAQSSKFKSVLSTIYLGREALKRGLKIIKEQYLLATELIMHDIQAQIRETLC